MKKLGNVTVLAPDRNWSASGHVKTMHRPLRVSERFLADGTPALAANGAPSDCVALAILGLIDDPIDLVVSGINPYANIGHDITYSGTVTAAMEAAISGIPGIAVSLHTLANHSGEKDYAPAAFYAKKVAKRVLEHGLPEQTLLSVNVPSLPLDEIKGIQVTRQGLRVYLDELVRREDPHGKPYYWIGGEFPSYDPLEGTDSGALERGYVSVTPIQLDLTDYKLMDEISKWDWEK
jgi:5'-nucleotidase